MVAEERIGGWGLWRGGQCGGLSSREQTEVAAALGDPRFPSQYKFGPQPGAPVTSGMGCVSADQLGTGAT